MIYYLGAANCKPPFIDRAKQTNTMLYTTTYIHIVKEKNKYST